MGDDLADGVRAKRRSPLVNAIAVYGTNVGGSALGLLNVLIVSRVLGADGRGSVAFALTTTMLVSQLSNLGVQTAIANFGGADRRLLPRLASNSILLAAAFGGVAIGVLALLMRLVPAVGGDVDPLTLWIALGSVPAQILAYYLFMLAQSQYRFGVMNVVLLLTPTANIAANGALAAAGALTVRNAVIAWTAGQCGGTAALAWYVHRRLGGFGRPEASLAKRMVGFGVKTHAGQIGMIGNYRLDQWLLGSIAGSRPLGLYSVAVAWAEVLFFLPNALSTVQRPDLVRSGRSEAGRQAAVGLRVALLLTLVSVVVMLAAAPFLCVTIFGEEFRGSVRDLRILALGAFGIVAIKQLGTALTSQNRPLLETAGILVAFGVTAVTDALLIPSHADLGASIASTLSYVAGGAAMTFFFVRALGAHPSELLPRVRDVRWFWGVLRERVRRPALSS